jgi:hypothetical protein
MNLLYVSVACITCYANDNDALIPEIWAMEGLRILEANLVMANLVHRDFSPLVANFGDVVNTRRPADLRSMRKTDADSVTSQDAVVTNVRVPLDQHHIQSIVIKDGEASKSMADLIQVHLEPAVKALARGVDRGLLGQAHRFFRTPSLRAGRLNSLSSSNAKDYTLEAREILNKNLATPEGRNLVLSPSSETALLKTDIFTKANERGDGGTALENARLGRILGFDTYMAQNVPALTTGADTIAGTITNALAAGGSGSQACTITGYDVTVGAYAIVAGNDQPTFVTARTFGTDTTAITLNEANKYATGASAVVTVFKACDVKGAFAAGYTKEIVVDGWTASSAPQVGQMISFGTGGSRQTYAILESYLSASGEQSLLLDRPLDSAIADNDKAFPGPYGAFNLAFQRDAIAMVNRPLARPMGVPNYVADYKGLTLRVVMQYDSSIQGHRVNLDLLCGYALLNANLGSLLLG